MQNKPKYRLFIHEDEQVVAVATHNFSEKNSDYELRFFRKEENQFVSLFILKTVH